MKNRRKRIHRVSFWGLSGFLMVVLMGSMIGNTGNFFSIHRVESWSIGIAEGKTPFELEISRHLNNPVLTSDDVKDVRALFVADPFVLPANSNFYMFFEVFNRDSNQGDIGFAASKDGKKWSYRQIVLDEPFHLSYPYVFFHEGKYYMIPESYKDSSVRLYVAENFPLEWRYEKTLLSGYDFVDPSILQHDGKWWIFASSRRNDILRLFYSDSLMGPWVEHSKSPIIQKDPTRARPAGRVIQVNNKMYRISQSDYPRYGLEVNAFEITGLNENFYEEIPYKGNPVLKSGTGNWNHLGMHHMDAHRIGENQWIASVDGIGERWEIAIGSMSYSAPEWLYATLRWMKSDASPNE